MKALVKKFAEPGIWMDDVAEPEYGAIDVLIEIKKTAICGTDVHIYRRLGTAYLGSTRVFTHL